MLAYFEGIFTSYWVSSYELHNSYVVLIMISKLLACRLFIISIWLYFDVRFCSSCDDRCDERLCNLFAFTIMFAIDWYLVRQSDQILPDIMVHQRVRRRLAMIVSNENTTVGGWAWSFATCYQVTFTSRTIGDEIHGIFFLEVIHTFRIQDVRSLTIYHNNKASKKSLTNDS